ncbi:MAG: hypothetical protein ACI9VM_000841 [Candidatus Azotimanducaceae bacterium]|jgi:hypothetical protein
MGHRSIIQIVLIIISVVIIITYIKPTFTLMQETQGETDEYQTAIANAESYRTELSALLARVEGFDDDNRKVLERYVPDALDIVAIMRDIETIVQNNKMVLTAVSAGDIGAKDIGKINAVQGQQSKDSQVIQNAGLQFQQFSVSVTGTYIQFKLLLKDFEINAYPLEIMNIEFSPGEGSLYTFSLGLETYSFTSNDETE